jgi:hypothetical protein
VTTPAFLELQRHVRLITEELASFRRRALQAEGRVRELEDALVAAEARTDEVVARGAPGAAAVQGSLGLDETPADADPRVDALSRENAALRTRLEGATDRTRQLLERVRFLRQQQEQEAAR